MISLLICIPANRPNKRYTQLIFRFIPNLHYSKRFRFAIDPLWLFQLVCDYFLLDFESHCFWAGIRPLTWAFKA